MLAELGLKALTDLKGKKTLKAASTHRTKGVRAFFEDISELKGRPLRKKTGFTFFKE